MTTEQQEKKWLEFQAWLKADSFEVYKEYLLRKQKAYLADVAKILRAEGDSLGKARIAQALADNITLVLTTHIDGILKELKLPDQTEDTQIY
jgi:hypothetical protein